MTTMGMFCASLNSPRGESQMTAGAAITRLAPSIGELCAPQALPLTHT